MDYDEGRYNGWTIQPDARPAHAGGWTATRDADGTIVTARKLSSLFTRIDSNDQDRKIPELDGN